MALITKPYTFSSGAVIVASEHNSNFDTLYNEINGSLNAANLAPNASIALSQISFTTALAMSSSIINFSKGADVASAAGNITLGNDGNFFDITGTAAITSITAKAAGTVVMMQFDSTASLVDGSNLKIAGNFQGAAESTITLVCDGTNWFEISRSPAYTASVTNALSGSVIQTVLASNSTVVTCNTTYTDDDDNPPLYNQGVEVINASITPNNTNNKLRISFNSWGGKATTGFLFIFLTNGNGTTASIKTNSMSMTNGDYATINLDHFIDGSIGTSPITFYIVIAPFAGTFYTLANSAGTRKHGTSSKNTLVIQEIKA